MATPINAATYNSDHPPAKPEESERQLSMPDAIAYQRSVVKACPTSEAYQHRCETAQPNIHEHNITRFGAISAHAFDKTSGSVQPVPTPHEFVAM